MTKPIHLNPVEHQMLLEVAKRIHQKPNQALVFLIKKAYETSK